MNENENLVSYGFAVGTVVGLVIGVIPLVTGMKKSQPALAVGGFFACVISGAVLGFILAIPMGALFWWLVKKAENRSKDFK